MRKFFLDKRILPTGNMGKNCATEKQHLHAQMMKRTRISRTNYHMLHFEGIKRVVVFLQTVGCNSICVEIGGLKHVDTEPKIKLVFNVLSVYVFDSTINLLFIRIIIIEIFIGK